MSAAFRPPRTIFNGSTRLVVPAALDDAISGAFGGYRDEIQSPEAFADHIVIWLHDRSLSIGPDIRLTDIRPDKSRTVTTVDGVELIVPPALDGAAHATLVGIKGQPVTATRVADLLTLHLHHQGWTIVPRGNARGAYARAFLPSEAGEVSASYADGGVMSTSRVAHDPSVGDAPTPPHATRREEHEAARSAALPAEEPPRVSEPAPVVTIGGQRFVLTFGLADASLLSIVAILQAHGQAPFNDHHNLRRVTAALCDMVLQYAEGASGERNLPMPSAEGILDFLTGLVRDEFYPIHAQRRERRAQQERPM